jgi:hypothetical protein
MKKLALLLALAMAFPLAASKDKHKDKHFDTVPIGSLSQAAGRYVGIEPDFVVTLTATGGTLRSQQGTFALANITLDRGELRGNAGGEPFSATFVNRTLNGQTAFGLVVHQPSVRLEGNVVLNDLFCRRQ